MQSPKWENVYEFILWENCNNNCQFCVQNKNRFLTDKEKRNSVETVVEFIRSPNFVPNSHVLVLGGELFDNKRDGSLLNDLFSVLVHEMEKRYINTLYINTNLIYKNTSSLENFLRLIVDKNLESRLHFTTSYDFGYRFKTDKVENLFHKNLKMIRNKYSTVNVVVNTILTRLVVNFITNGLYTPRMFEELYDVTVNPIPYVGHDKFFKPKRLDVITSLKLIRDDWGDVRFGNYVASMLAGNKKIVYRYNKDSKELENVTCDNSECCGHSENFRLFYSDSNKCFLCDLEKFV